MIEYLPNLDDGIQALAFVPMLTTLYGRDEEPYRFVRVLGSGLINGRATQPVTIEDTSFVIENVDIETFVTFLSYGYTPYLECALTGFESGLGFEPYQEFFVSQANIRHYENRAQELLKLADNKKLSLIGKTKMSQSTSELCDELDGVLSMWEMLMNTGTIRPTNCLQLAKFQHKSEVMIPMKRYQEKYEELEHRMLYNTYSDIPFKVTEEKRAKFLSVFKNM